VSRFLTAYQLVGSHWKIQDRRQIKNTDSTQTKHTQKKQTMQSTVKHKLIIMTIIDLYSVVRS